MPLPRLLCDHHELLHPTGFVAGLTCHPHRLASPHSCCCQRRGQRRPTRLCSPPARHARPGPRSVRHALRRCDDEPYARRMTLSTIQVRRTPHAHIHTRTKAKNSALNALHKHTYTSVYRQGKCAMPCKRTVPEVTAAKSINSNGVSGLNVGSAKYGRKMELKLCGNKRKKEMN